MKEIVFVSGKGGTGKSTLAASLIQLVNHKVMADCDVDAPNLHLLFPHTERQTHAFWGADMAAIDLAACTHCGLCTEVCRFDAISDEQVVSETLCEGCGACAVVCPVDAIRLHPVVTGKTFIDRTAYGMFSHALLDIGAEGSGKLVTEVKENMHAVADDSKVALVDGSPGIGCAVIASITGADAMVAVCEPTQSGQRDLARVLGVARHFGVMSFVCINKYDLDRDVTAAIEEDCQAIGVPVLAKIPFDEAIVQALRQLKTPVDAGLTDVIMEIKKLWAGLCDHLGLAPKGG